MEMSLVVKLAEMLKRVRGFKPLVHHITNFVVMELTANVTLHVGGSPVMAHSLDEVKEMVKLASCLNINMGTLEPAWVEAMLVAGKQANTLGIPVVFDPVGNGATPYRTETASRIVSEVKLAVLRGNGGEIGVLAKAGGEVKGVDSVGGPANPAGVAKMLAKKLGIVVAITGEIDYVSDGERTFAIRNGDEYLTKLTGTGCSATATISCFIGANKSDPCLAAVAALSFFGAAAEKAAQDSSTRGPSSFKVNFHDTLAAMTVEEYCSLAKVEEVIL